MHKQPVPVLSKDIQKPFIKPMPCVSAKDNWQTDPLQFPKVTFIDAIRGVLRATLLILTICTGLMIFLLVRLAEYPFFKTHHPWTSYIRQLVCRMVLLILGVRLVQHSRQMEHIGGFVSNHVSWLDIFILGAVCTKGYFVSKSEVSNWFGIGFMARVTGTLFITRKNQDAKNQQALFQKRLSLGHQLIFFPEGTTTDGMRLLRFKSSLFEAFFQSDERRSLYIQPITMVYTAPRRADPRFYGWWGNMELAPSLWHSLALAKHGSVTVTFSPPLKVKDYQNRKAIAHQCYEIIHQNLSKHITLEAKSLKNSP